MSTTRKQVLYYKYKKELKNIYYQIKRKKKKRSMHICVVHPICYLKIEKSSSAHLLFVVHPIC